MAIALAPVMIQVLVELLEQIMLVLDGRGGKGRCIGRAYSQIGACDNALTGLVVLAMLVMTKLLHHQLRISF